MKQILHTVTILQQNYPTRDKSSGLVIKLACIVIFNIVSLNGQLRAKNVYFATKGVTKLANGIQTT